MTPRLETPDLERVLPGVIKPALTTRWPAVFVGRDKPSDPRPHVVTVQRSGGVTKGAVLDDVRVAVNVYAPTEVDANDLAETVRSVMQALTGTAPFARIEASAPAPIPGTAEPAHRFFHAECLVRRQPA